MAVLAGGPYGVADVAGALNKSLLMHSCRDDGVLLYVWLLSVRALLMATHSQWV